MIVADTGAIIALADRQDPLHETMVDLYEQHAAEWVLPWAILPEVDYLLGAHVGKAAQAAFQDDLSSGAYSVEWGSDQDLGAAAAILAQYASLDLGLVDAIVMSTAARSGARAIVTLDERDFAAVQLPGTPALWPRDLTRAPIRFALKPAPRRPRKVR